MNTKETQTRRWENPCWRVTIGTHRPSPFGWLNDDAPVAVVHKSSIVVSAFDEAEAAERATVLATELFRAPVKNVFAANVVVKCQPGTHTNHIQPGGPS